jgi:hypothetical protein
MIHPKPEGKTLPSVQIPYFLRLSSCLLNQTATENLKDRTQNDLPETRRQKLAVCSLALFSAVLKSF